MRAGVRERMIVSNPWFSNAKDVIKSEILKEENTINSKQRSQGSTYRSN
jgi:hypothetical protein